MTSKPSDRPSTSGSVTARNLGKLSRTAKDDARLKQFDQVVAGCRELFDLKNIEYADSISRTGVLGSAVAIVGLSARLEHMILGAADAGKSQEEGIVDIVKDLINYGVITGIMIMDDNWRPE